VLDGTVAEAYVDTGVKVLIAVVIGALILTLLYALFNDIIMPTVAARVIELFSYAG
jgi:large-conductance mechanosensitive channel